MKLTPLDIHHKEFRRSIRGYNEEDVDVFLDQVAEEFERVFKENTELKEQVGSMKDKVKQYEGVEQTLQKALFTGQQAADQVKENAQKESELIIGDAEKKAKDIIHEVQKEKEAVVAELKRLCEAEDRFRVDFKELLNRFLTESDEVKVSELPREAEEALVAEFEPEEPVAPAEEPVSVSEADAPTEPEIEVDEEPNEPAALNVDAAGTVDSQASVVVADPEPPAMSDISQTVEPPAEVAVPTEPEAAEAQSDSDRPAGMISSPTSADIAGNSLSTSESSEEAADEVSEPPKTDYFQESPQTPDIGAGGSFFEEQTPRAHNEAEPSTDTQPTSELKITLGAPVQETPAEPSTSEPNSSGMPTEILADLKNQEVPEFDPTVKKEGDSKPAGSDDVVSNFFDDDLGGDD